MTIEEIKNLDLEAIEARIAEIKTSLEDENSDFEALNAELDAIVERKSVLVEEQRKADIEAVIAGAGEETTITLPEERTMPTLEEVRKSQAYIEAYAKYIKTEDKTECRALLTELVQDGTVPVPSFIEDEIRTAWENSELLSRIKKSYVDGILRVGFELSATGAVIHTEGAKAIDDEELVIGVITLTPASIKKMIHISDEAIDLTGEAFLRYIYDELTYQITKKLEDEVIALIENAPATSDADEIGVPVVESEPSLTTVVEALAELTSKASKPVVIINRKTYATFKALAVAASYAMDPFEGLPVIYNDTIDAYADADAGDTYMIVGDLIGVQANFPKGEGVTIKYDDKSEAEADLVKIVGREYVALGITAPKHIAKVAKPTES
jgi:HK97 family phage major capsid protein